MSQRLGDDQLNGVASLGDPRRRALYRYVVEQTAGVGRDEAATAVGVTRSLAAYHLDHLVDDGLLVARYERTSGKRGPGAGRPSKLYERSPRQFQVDLPPRDYELAAQLFARAFDDSTAHDPRDALLTAARRFGAELSKSALTSAPRTAKHRRQALLDTMRGCGYEPIDAEDGIRLRNCPFDALATDHRDLVCGMNLALIEGLVEGLDNELQPILDPQPGTCCVKVQKPPH